MKKILTILIISTLAYWHISTLVFAQKNISLRSYLPYGGKANDIWGYTDTATAKEYAIVGLSDSVSIVDVTDPVNPQVLFNISGPNSVWRDIKTWNKHAFVTHDATSDTAVGLLIIDLSNLPASIDTFYYTGDTLNYLTAHNIFIDENGFCYLFGSNVANGGTLILNLSNPQNPVYVGTYSANYVHDGYVRGDTMWTAEIYEGQFSVVDVSDKANPVVLATQSTPNAFTHNCWLSDDGKTLFITDEQAGSFVVSYDVSDLSNIKQADLYQTNPGTGVIPHNTYYLDSFLITSYYTEGITIVDATKPDNLVEVAYYDTSPYPSETSFNGCWGVYPYLTSGNILASDRQEGLFILSPNYTRACYLEGTVTDSMTGDSLKDVKVELIGTGISQLTDINGIYKTGIADSGLYDIRFWKKNCFSKIFIDVSLQKGLTTTINTKLYCTPPSSIDGHWKSRTGNVLYAAPNVFSNTTTIYFSFENAFEAGRFLLYNINGKMIKNIELNTSSGEITLNNNLAPGIYFIRLVNKNVQETIRIVKTK